MNYRINSKNGDEISILGFGCMRLPKADAEVDRLVAEAIELGVNYFDTAYIYPGNETALGRALARGERRSKVKIATKLPPYLIKRYEDFDRIFNTQLERLKCEYIDYYLIHMLTRPEEWQRLVELDVLRWIDDKKHSGRIRNLGFSFHGNAAAFVEIIGSYNWEFAMIQYNYFDQYNQAGVSGLKFAADKSIPIMIMEPLRGGQLVNKLPREALAVFNEASRKRTPAQWGLSWVWNHPEVLTVLSGMNSMDMLRENAQTAAQATAGCLDSSDMERFERVSQILISKNEVPCTGCGYCMPCPGGVDIPFCFSSLNDKALIGLPITQLHYLLRSRGVTASRCVNCGKCEQHCPQGIAIRSELKKVSKTLEGPLYRVLRPVIERFMKRV